MERKAHQFLQIMLFYIGFAKAFYAFTGLSFNALRRKKGHKMATSNRNDNWIM